jgi:tRNA(His) 5'-end guanylyltransferase
MPVNDELGKRMKEYYENIPKTKLMRRTPVAIRLDGKAFHTFTRGFQKPFDEVLIKSMQETMKYLCENIQGCVLGYTQSDEITLILVDYKNLNSSAWFDYEVQKMCSIAASMATMHFNRRFKANIDRYCVKNYINCCNLQNVLTVYSLPRLKEEDSVLYSYYNSSVKGAMFDARVFNIPKEEVTNLIYWRQLDATRNSIQMVGQANFSYKELQNKSCNMIQNMLLTEKDINWNNFPTHQKCGSCCIKENYFIDNRTGEEANITVSALWKKEWLSERTRWVIDTEIPIFKDEGREYIEKLINF